MRGAFTVFLNKIAYTTCSNSNRKFILIFYGRFDATLGQLELWLNFGDPQIEKWTKIELFQKSSSPTFLALKYLFPNLRLTTNVLKARQQGPTGAKWSQTGAN